MGELKPRDGWLDDRLHWLEWGPAQAPPVLLVHGITGNARNWDALAAAAAGARRIVALDLRGHGESAWAAGETYEHLDYMADLLEIIDRLGAPVSLVGHSIGGHICLILAALRPELATSLVLVDVEAFPPREQPERLRRLGAGPDPTFANLDAVVRELRAHHPGVREPRLRAKAEHDTLARPDGSRIYRFDRGVLRRVTAPDARPYLPMVRCPVLLVRGGESTVMRAEAAREMAASLPRACVVEVPGAGHWPQFEDPDAFAEAVCRFLDGEGHADAPEPLSEG